MIAHLWQSTFCVAAAWAVTLALKNNRAAVRYGIWLAASVKFLVPFSLLVTAGSHFAWRPAPAVAIVLQEIGSPFSPAVSMPVTVVAPAAPDRLPIMLLCVWFCGFALGVASWMRWCRQIRVAQRASMPLDLNLPIRVMSSPGRREPGVFGILRPVLLLPEGISDCLTPAQLKAILAHELCHVRRRDNLTGAIHMVVEAIFWFHPLVWWIRTRLLEERERACDEEVLRMGGDAETYAEGILRVCRFYVETPAVCVSGITGSDLKKRIEAIVMRSAARELDFGRRAFLATVGILAVMGPVAIGTLYAPRLRADTQTSPSSPPVFEVASIKRATTPGVPSLRYNPAGIDFAGVPLMWLIGEAYQVPYARISSSDSRIADLFFSPAGTSYVYDISARASHAASKSEVRLMLRSLLQDRFKVALHSESKVVPVYKLMIGKKGAKLQESAAEGEPAGALGLTGFICQHLEMARFASMLSVHMDRPVVDRSELKGSYDFTLKTNFPAGAEKTALAEWFSSSIFADIQNQLGLQLQADKAAVEYLMVDHVEQPSTN